MDFSICIGLDYYITLTPPTPYAENDAKEMNKVFTDTFEAENNQLLIGHKATLRTIAKAFKQVFEKIEEGDRLLVFYAGHGQNFNGIPHLSTYDSDDESDSWISLAEIIDQINQTSKRALLFIDACESTHTLGTRAIKIDGFDVKQLKDRTKDSEYCCVFSATSSKGVADVMVEKQHGIFSYYLIKAMSGSAEDALVNSKLLTTNSLKSYLFDSMKMYGKTNPNTIDLQTPYLWGKDQGDVIVVEFEEALPVQFDAVSESCVNRITFVTKRNIRVRDLSGFEKGKGHKPPKYYSGAVDRFISNIAAADVEENTRQVEKSLQEIFDLRRRDIQVIIDGSTGRIECPYCYYDCFVEIDKDDLDYVIMTMRLTPIDLNMLYEKADELDEGLPYWFDYLMYKLPKRINVNDLVDAIEDAGKKKEYMLEYESDDYLRVTIENKRTITIRNSSVEINFKAQETVPSMIDGLKEIANQVALISENKTLLLE